jgi:hypothetical protein
LLEEIAESGIRQIPPQFDPQILAEHTVVALCKPLQISGSGSGSGSPAPPPLADSRRESAPAACGDLESPSEF